MNKIQAVTGMLLGGFLVLSLSAHATDAVGTSEGLVVGTFDSRAVAVAYVASDGFQELMRAKHAELAEAKANGDEKLVAELEAFGPALQQRIHQQGFGTAPVDDILARIEDELPAIADASGVDVIVSKWALAYRRPEAKFVDVTDRLTAEFEPSEKTLKTIRELVASEPVPPDRLREDH